MKYLVVLAVVLVVIWYWRNSRGGAAERKDTSGRAPKAEPQDMVQCPVCHVHLPRTDALPGPDGRLYCCADHRLRAGD
jgi:uncharacterized protein